MKLTGLNPAWGNGHPDREGIGLWFDCPGACCANMAALGRDATGKAINFDPEEGKSKKMRLYVPFANPIDGKPQFGSAGTYWQRTGDTFETLTLTPSVDASAFRHWHGFITAGEIR